MTNKEKMLVEKHIDNITRKILREFYLESDKQNTNNDKHNKKDDEKEAEKSRGDEETTTRTKVMRWLDSIQTLHSQLAYRLFNAREQDDKDAARSLFSKKYRNAKNDNGSVYDFNDEEINGLASMMDTFLNPIT